MDVRECDKRVLSDRYVRMVGSLLMQAPTNSTPEPKPEPTQTPQVNLDAPVRDPVSGSCDCPYDTDRRGRSCGKRSAYSRPGGRSPICYVRDLQAGGYAYRQ